MPTYRRNYRRKGYKKRYKKRYGLTRHRKPDAFDYARSAWKATKQIKRLINVEVKRHFFSEVITATTPGVGINDTWASRSLCSVAQGDTTLTRDGNSIKPLSLSIRMLFQIAQSTQANFIDRHLRVILLRAKSEQGAGATEVLSAYTGNNVLSVNEDILSFKNPALLYNTTTLMDKVYKLRSCDQNNTGITRLYINESLKLSGHINFAGSTTAPEDGGIYMVFCTDLPSTVSGSPALSINSVLTFTDN